LTAFLLLAVAAPASDSQDMNPQKLAEIPARMKEFVAAGTISGIVTILARHGQIV
jgi:L-asparaginase/Glu-tRNA(Gln) amidotransferase subunit D